MKNLMCARKKLNNGETDLAYDNLFFSCCVMLYLVQAEIKLSGNTYLSQQ